MDVKRTHDNQCFLSNDSTLRVCLVSQPRPTRTRALCDYIALCHSFKWVLLGRDPLEFTPGVLLYVRGVGPETWSAVIC